MAAAERLRGSLRRMHAPTTNRRPAHSSKNNIELNIEDELAKLQPSQRLLDFYRAKIAKFDEENQHLIGRFDKYKEVTKPTLDEDERKKMTHELIELRSALSDLNIFIHAERQQVARLYAENERLQLDNLEAEKKVALLLSLSGLTEGELQVFLRDPRNTTILHQKLPPHLKKLHNRLKDKPKEPGMLEMTEVEVTLRERVKSLERQLEECETAWQLERDALLQDRTLTASENKAQQVKNESHTDQLAYRLEQCQELLSKAIRDEFMKTAEVKELEMQWLAERDHLLSVLASVEETIPLVAHAQAIEKSGSYTDLTQMKPTCELKDLRRENESLKHEVAEAEELRALYETQCHQLDQEMCRLREQKEAAEQLFKERNKKLHQQIELLKDENRKLDERRRTDIKGFQSDIQLLKRDMRSLVHQMYKITLALTGEEVVPVDLDTLSELQAMSALVRTVQRVIADTKRRVLKLENEINNPLE